MIEDFKAQFELKLKDYLNEESSKAPSAEARLLISRISTLILRGGKRFRPLLLFKTYEAYGGTDQDNLINLCLSLELFHQALLIHDDIIDDDTIRYNGPNVVGYYNEDSQLKGTKIPESMGLLAGDLLLALSNQIIANDTNFSDTQKSKILSLMNLTMTQVIYGQQLDSLNTTKSLADFNEQNLVLLYSLKSASYTTQLPIRLASIILDIPTAEQNIIDNFARPFGIYFQLVDDYADYFKVDSLFENRSKFRDYPEGKVTYPYYAGLKLAKSPQVKILKQYFGTKTLSIDLKKEVLSILINCAADKASIKFAESYYKDSLKAIDQLSLSDNYKDQFKQLLNDIKI